MKNNTMKTMSYGKKGWGNGLLGLLLCLVICSLLAVTGTTLATSPVQATVTIDDPGLLHATVGQQFYYNFSFSGSGDCPGGGFDAKPGLTLSHSVWLRVNEKTGQIYGTPTAAGTYNYTIYWNLNVWYPGGNTCKDGASRHFQIEVAPPYKPPTNPSIGSFTANPTIIQPGQPGTTPASSTAAVTVRPWDPPTISVGKSTIQSGKSTTLTWNAPGATKVTISDAGTFGASGSTAVTPNGTTTYNLKATYGDGTSLATSATVIVEAEQPPYLLYSLVVLLALAAAAVTGYLLVKRSAVRPALQSGNTQPVSTVQPAPPLSAEPTRATLLDTSQATAVATGAPTMVAAPPARFTLAGGGEIPLSGSARSYGRNDFKSLTSPEKSSLLSLQHLLINYDNGHYYIEDQDSNNGTKVNGEEIRGTGKHALKDGDVIDLADGIKMNFKI